MRKVFGVLLFSGSLVLFAGCDSGGNSSVTEDATQSAVEQYEANLAEAEADMDAAGDPTEAEAEGAPTDAGE